MNFGELINKGVQTVKVNSPEILTSVSLVGLGATAYLASTASYKMACAVSNDENEAQKLETRTEFIKRRAKTHWKLYIPPAVVGVATATCILGSNKAGGRRTAAAVAAYSLTEKAYTEYKERVVEQLGSHKEQKIRDEMAVKRIVEDKKDIVILGSGDFLCCELYTMRYFMADMERLKRAQNTINSKAINALSNHVTLDTFYDEVGLPYTSKSSLLGWDSDRQMELEFTSVLTPDNRPCLAFDYNYVKPVS